MVYSLLCAKEWLSMSDCIVSYADIYYTFEVIKDLVNCLMTSQFLMTQIGWNYGLKDLRSLDDAETFKITQSPYFEIGQKPKTVEEIRTIYGFIKV